MVLSLNKIFNHTYYGRDVLFARIFNQHTMMSTTYDYSTRLMVFVEKR